MSQFLDVALEAARKSEEAILKHYRPGIQVKTKGDMSPVTIADTEAESIIRETILSYFPDHAILGEEEGQKGDHEYLWILDPIDGTKNYMRTIPIWGTQIALMHKGEIIVGVSNMPALKEMMWAEKGGGAFCNGERIRVSEMTDLAESFMTFGNLLHFEKLGLIDSLVALEKKTRGHRGYGDCWMYHLLAQGKLDIVIEAKLKIWDIAAAVCIVREAGGIFTDITGQPITTDTTSVLATNAHLHAEVLAALTH